MLNIKNYLINQKEKNHCNIENPYYKIDILKKMNKNKNNLTDYKNNLMTDILNLELKIQEKKDLSDYIDIKQLLNKFDNLKNIQMDIISNMNKIKKHNIRDMNNKEVTLNIKKRILKTYNKRINILSIILIK